MMIIVKILIMTLCVFFAIINFAVIVAVVVLDCCVLPW